ncbi:ImmA/IrrE family metallo-endopeptidase [Williamsia sp. SKLECPSW1]
MTGWVELTRNRARNDAQAVLDVHWDTDRLPVDPVEIARALGLNVFTAELGDDIFGMLVGNRGGADVFLDQDQPPARFRFTCAHEVGHYVDNSSRLDADEAYVDKRSDDGKGSVSEVYANEFAGSLLMPVERLKEMINSGRSEFQIAREFAVSLDALRYRRKLLGV